MSSGTKRVRNQVSGGADMSVSKVESESEGGVRTRDMKREARLPGSGNQGGDRNGSGIDANGRATT